MQTEIRKAANTTHESMHTSQRMAGVRALRKCIYSSEIGNVYYHVNIPCILTRCPYFMCDMLVIPPDIAMQLLPAHTELLAQRMHRCQLA